MSSKPTINSVTSTLTIDQKYQLRRLVYEEFLSILNTLYLEKAPFLKHEEIG